MVEPNGKEEQGRHNLLGAAALSWLISVFLFASPSYLSITGGTAAVLNVLAIIAIAFSLYATGYTVDELAFGSGYTFASIGIGTGILVAASRLHLLSEGLSGRPRLLCRAAVLLLAFLGGLIIILGITVALEKPLAGKPSGTEPLPEGRKGLSLNPTAVFTALVAAISLATAVVQFLTALEGP